MPSAPRAAEAVGLNAALWLTLDPCPSSALLLVQVRVSVSRNEVLDDAVLVRLYRSEIMELKRQVAALLSAPGRVGWARVRYGTVG